MDALGDQCNLPSFEVFCEHLIREQSKLQQLDALSSSQALVAQSSKGKGQSDPQKKDFDKVREPPSHPQQKSKSSPQTSRFEMSSTKTGKKRSNESCSFCGKEGHS